MPEFALVAAIGGTKIAAARIDRTGKITHSVETPTPFGNDTPEKRPVEGRERKDAKVISIPRVGGLHHRYTLRLAA